MQKINFQNLPNTTTPINATNLNAIQTNAENAINLKADTSSLSTVATSGSYADLTNKPTIPTNSDFTLNGLSEKSYNNLTDKPTIPTVNNATLTIQKNGSNVATFTANASSNVTANIEVPSVSTGSSVVSRSSGAALEGSTYVKYGNVVQLTISCTTSAAVNTGSNAFQGTISNNAFKPKSGINGCSYSASVALIGYIDTDGSITVRVLASNMAKDRPFNISFTYIVD